MMVGPLAGEAAPSEHPPPVPKTPEREELDDVELSPEDPVEPPRPEELEATDELLPASAEELPPPPDALLELLLDLEPPLED
jgi:hypothetical protein